MSSFLRQRPVLDRRVVGNRKRTRIGFVRIHAVIRTGTRGWSGGTMTKFMSRLNPSGLSAPMERDDRGRPRVQRPLRDVLVPGIVRRKDLKRAQDAVGLRRVEEHRPAEFDDGRVRLTPAIARASFRRAASYGSPVSGKLTVAPASENTRGTICPTPSSTSRGQPEPFAPSSDTDGPAVRGEGWPAASSRSDREYRDPGRGAALFAGIQQHAVTVDVTR